MNKVLITVLSKHHTTELYAKWIAEEVDCDLISAQDFDSITLEDYSVVVFGSWVYLDKIKIAPLVIENWDKLKSKHVIVFSNAVTDPQGPKTKDIFEDSFPEHIRNSLYFFPLGGKLEINHLNFIEKTTLKVKKKFRELNNIDKEMVRPIIVKIYDLKVIGR